MATRFKGGTVVAGVFEVVGLIILVLKFFRVAIQVYQFLRERLFGRTNRISVKYIQVWDK
jgi:hypothetical protein